MDQNYQPNCQKVNEDTKISDENDSKTKKTQTQKSQTKTSHTQTTQSQTKLSSCHKTREIKAL